MKKYEAIIILNPNLSSKADNFIKDFEKTLKENSFIIKKCENIGRRQLSYSINNHNKGHYLILNIEGDPIKLIDIEMLSFLLPLASKIISDAVDKIPEDAELGEKLIDICLVIIGKAVKLTKTEADDKLFEQVKEAIKAR